MSTVHGSAERGFADHVERMRAALTPVVARGRDFLAGTIDADAMTGSMVNAVAGYQAGEEARRKAAAEVAEPPPDDDTRVESRELRAALAEIGTCGSGYRAGRCDADCVARTMTVIVQEFADLVPQP